MEWKWSIHWTRVQLVIICQPSNGQVQEDVFLESHRACVGSINGAECSWTFWEPAIAGQTHPDARDHHAMSLGGNSF